jgi:phage repressor protein C with HTH and peptisase S24 domain
MRLSDVRMRLGAMGKRQAWLARELELDPSLLTKTLDGKRALQPHERATMERIFGEIIEVNEIVTEPPPSRRRSADRIPVFGVPSGGEGRVVYDDQHILEWGEPPPFWSGAGSLIYVRMPGESMEPRYHDGEIVPVRLGFPPARGEDCLIEFKDGTIQLACYDGTRDGFVFAKRYNPAGVQQIEATQVRALHAVWRPRIIS